MPSKICKKIIVEIADTPEKRSEGLMFRRSLPSDFGMLFIFESPRLLSFWGKNTYIPLDIAFITEDNKIASIRKIIPLSTRSVASGCYCKYAIETASNFFSKNDIRVGDSVKIENNEVTFIKES